MAINLNNCNSYATGDDNKGFVVVNTQMPVDGRLLAEVFAAIQEISRLTARDEAEQALVDYANTVITEHPTVNDLVPGDVELTRSRAERVRQVCATAGRALPQALSTFLALAPYVLPSSGQ